MTDLKSSGTGAPDQKPPKSERAFIEALARELPDFASPHGFGDDLAPLEARPGGLLWTTDMLMDGVDFLSSQHSWRQIGRKAMAVNLSDCAASATIPVSAVCAVALNNAMSMDDALELYRGMRDCGLEHKCPITGGDTNSWDAPAVISITVAASPVPGLPPVKRSGAQPGDKIYLTGPVGGSILGRHLEPKPRIQVACAINRGLSPHAMIDISDGLVVDLWHLCEASGCGAVLEEGRLHDVVHPDAEVLAKKTGRNPLEHALYDGEDFELIVAVPARFEPDQCRQFGLTLIGEFRPNPAIFLHEPGRSPRQLEIRGWEHFRDETH